MGGLPGSENLLPPVLFLLLLAVVGLIIALVPRCRKSLSWGRTADAYPVSRSGCLFACAAFLVMAGGLAAAHFGLLSPPTSFLILLLGFLLFVTAGLLDRPRR